MKAIETIYNNYRFRSRLEARWAIFFDTLGIRYEYEKEGYDLGGVRYLPDFWLPDQDCWFEVKGDKVSHSEYLKMRELGIHTDKRVHVAIGSIEAPGEDEIGVPIPFPVRQNIHTYLKPREAPERQEDPQWIYPDTTFSTWKECKDCHEIAIYTGKETECLCGASLCLPFGLWKRSDGTFLCNPNHASPRLIAAYTAARQARFEHGERR